MISLENWVEEYAESFQDDVDTHLGVMCPELDEEDRDALLRLIMISARQWVQDIEDDGLLVPASVS